MFLDIARSTALGLVPFTDASSSLNMAVCPLMLFIEQRRSPGSSAWHRCSSPSPRLALRNSLVFHWAAGVFMRGWQSTLVTRSLFPAALRCRSMPRRLDALACCKASGEGFSSCALKLPRLPRRSPRPLSSWAWHGQLAGRVPATILHCLH